MQIVLVIGIIVFGIFSLPFWPRQVEHRYVPVAYYDKAVTTLPPRGMDHTNLSECLESARKSFRSSRYDVVWGDVDYPADGTQAPFSYGCQKVDPEGRAVDYVR